MRHIAAGVFQGGCAPAGPALKWRLKILFVAKSYSCFIMGLISSDGQVVLGSGATLDDRR
jgi:hypothetical protein